MHFSWHYIANSVSVLQSCIYNIFILAGEELSSQWLDHVCGRSCTYWLVKMWIRLRFFGNTSIHSKVTFIGWIYARQYPCTKQTRPFPDASHVPVKRERENKHSNKYDFNNDNSLKKMKWDNLRNHNLRKEAVIEILKKHLTELTWTEKNNDKESSVNGGGVSFFKAERTVRVMASVRERRIKDASLINWEWILGRITGKGKEPIGSQLQLRQDSKKPATFLVK